MFTSYAIINWDHMLYDDFEPCNKFQFLQESVSFFFFVVLLRVMEVNMLFVFFVLLVSNIQQIRLIY